MRTDARSLLTFLEELDDPALVELAYACADPESASDPDCVDEELLELAERLPLVETTARRELRRRGYGLADDGALRISYGGETIPRPSDPVEGEKNSRQ